jgi:hypothetical protein
VRHRATRALVVLGTLFLLLTFLPTAAAQEDPPAPEDTTVSFYVVNCRPPSTFDAAVDGEAVEGSPFTTTFPESLYTITIPDGVPGNVLGVICNDGESIPEAVNIFPGAGTCNFGDFEDGEVIKGHYTGKYNEICIKIVAVNGETGGGGNPCDLDSGVAKVVDDPCDPCEIDSDTVVASVVVEEIVDPCEPTCDTEAKTVVAKVVEEIVDPCLPTCDDGKTVVTSVVTEEVVDPCLPPVYECDVIVGVVAIEDKVIEIDPCDIDECEILQLQPTVAIDEPVIDEDPCIIDECKVITFQPAIEIEPEVDDCVIDECLLKVQPTVVTEVPVDECDIDECEVLSRAVVDREIDDCEIDDCVLTFQPTIIDEEPTDCVLSECDLLRVQPAIELDDGRELVDICDSIEADLVDDDGSSDGTYTEEELKKIAEAKAAAQAKGDTTVTAAGSAEALGATQSASVYKTWNWAANGGSTLDEGGTGLSPASLAGDPTSPSSAALDAAEPASRIANVVVSGANGYWILQVLGALAVVGALGAFLMNRRRITL